MEDFIIRRATEQDLTDIQRLSQEFIEYEKSIATKEYMINLNWALSQDGYNNYKANINRDYVYVVCDKDIIIGYMTCWINKQQPWDKYKVFEIGNIYIKEAYRRKGIGTKLINIAKSICKENDIKFLKISVLEDNKAAFKFYEKNGLYKYLIEQLTEIN